MNKIIIFGKKGFVANSLIQKLKTKKILFKSFSKKEINLENKSSVKKIKRVVKKNSIVIFISAIAPCKNIHQLRQNKKMAKNFIQAIKKINIFQLIYLSSDAVYSDSKKKKLLKQVNVNLTLTTEKCI